MDKIKKEGRTMVTEFGKVLRIIRISTGDSAKEMASKLGISVPYLNAIENGRRDVPSNLADKVISVYELSEKDKEALRESLIQSKDRVKIDLTELAEKQRKIIMALARNEVDETTLDEIVKMVNLQKGESQ